MYSCGVGKSMNIFIVADSVHVLSIMCMVFPWESCFTFKLLADKCIVSRDAPFAILLANITVILSAYNV